MIDELLTDDFVQHEELPPGVPQGKGAPRAMMTMMRAAFPDFHAAIEELLEDGEKVIACPRKSGSEGLAELVGRYPDRLIEIPMDVGDDASVAAAGRAIRAHRARRAACAPRAGPARSRPAPPPPRTRPARSRSSGRHCSGRRSQPPRPGQAGRLRTPVRNQAAAPSRSPAVYYCAEYRSVVG